jgi:hypothetical protein
MKIYNYSVKGTGIDLENGQEFSIGESSFHLTNALKTIMYYTENEAFENVNLVLTITSL